MKLKNKGAKEALAQACQAALNDARESLRAAAYIPDFPKKIIDARQRIEKAQKLYNALKEF